MCTQRPLGKLGALGPWALRQLCDLGQVTFARCLSPLISQGWVRLGGPVSRVCPRLPGPCPACSEHAVLTACREAVFRHFCCYSRRQAAWSGDSGQRCRGRDSALAVRCVALCRWLCSSGFWRLVGPEGWTGRPLTPLSLLPGRVSGVTRAFLWPGKRQPGLGGGGERFSCSDSHAVLCAALRPPPACRAQKGAAAADAFAGKPPARGRCWAAGASCETPGAAPSSACARSQGVGLVPCLHVPLTSCGF